MAASLIYPDVEIVDIVVIEQADDGLAPPPDPGKLLASYLLSTKLKINRQSSYPV
jgi:hypothetical protein